MEHSYCTGKWINLMFIFCMEDVNFILWTIMTIIRAMGGISRWPHVCKCNTDPAVVFVSIVDCHTRPLFIYTAMTHCITFAGFLGIQIIHFFIVIFPRTCDDNLMQTFQLHKYLDALFLLFLLMYRIFRYITRT
jgi:hypothetical protein